MYLHDELLCYLEGKLTIHTLLIFLQLLAVHGARVRLSAIYSMQLFFFFENDYQMRNRENNLEKLNFLPVYNVS